MADNKDVVAETRSGFHKVVNRLVELTQTATAEELSLEQIRELTADTLSSINTNSMLGRMSAKSQLSKLQTLTKQLDMSNEGSSQLLSVQQNAYDEIKNQNIKARFKELGKSIYKQTLDLTQHASDIAKDVDPLVATMIGLFLMIKGTLVSFYSFFKRDTKAQNDELANIVKSIKQGNEDVAKGNNTFNDTQVDSNTILRNTLESINNIEGVMKSSATDDDRTNLNKKSKERQSAQNEKLSKKPKEQKPGTIKRKAPKQQKSGMFSRMLFGIGMLATALIPMIAGFVTSFVATIVGLVAAIGPLIAGATAALGPIALVVAGLAILTKLGFNIAEDIGNAKTILGKDNITLSDKIAVAGGSLIGSIGELIDSVLGIFGIETNLKDEWTKSVSIYVADYFDNWLLNFKALGEMITNFDITEWSDGIKLHLSDMFTKVKDMFKDMLFDILDWFDLSNKDFNKTINNVKSSATEIVTKTADAVLDLKDDAVEILKDTNKFSKKILESINDTVGQSDSWLASSLQSTGSLLGKTTAKLVQTATDTLNNLSTTTSSSSRRRRSSSRSSSSRSSRRGRSIGETVTKTDSHFDSINFALGFKGGNITGMSEAQTRAYAANTAKTESRGNMQVVNDYGYMGQYQFGAQALADIGFIDNKKRIKARKKSGKNWFGGTKDHRKFMLDNSNWLKSSSYEFRSNKQMQDDAFIKYTNKNISRGFNKGVGIHKTANPIRLGAYAKAAHLKGNGGANALFKRNISSTDANGTSTRKYASQARYAIKTLAPAVQSAMTAHNNKRDMIASSKKDTKKPEFKHDYVNLATRGPELDLPTSSIHQQVAVQMKKEAMYNQSKIEPAPNVYVNNSQAGNTTASPDASRARGDMPTRDSENLGRIPISSRAFGIDYA